MSSIAVKAGRRFRSPDPAGGAGSFWFVTDGALAYPAGAHLKRLDMAWAAAVDPAFDIEALEEGVEVLIKNSRAPEAPAQAAPNRSIKAVTPAASCCANPPLCATILPARSGP